MEMSAALRTKLSDHVGTHLEGGYPATCNAVVSACNGLMDFTPEEKEWVSKALPHGTFNSADDVKRALHI
jgi:hypothetical protein